MKVKIKLFSELRLMLNRHYVELDIPESSTVKAAIEALIDQYDDKLKLKISDEKTKQYKVTFSVNNRMSTETTILNEGDTLAIVPPVAGG